MKKIFSIFICILVILSMSSAAFADSSAGSDFQYNGAPVYGDFIADPSMVAEIAQKEATARRGARSIAADPGYILAITQVPQDNGSFCGFASMKSLLNYRGLGVYETQSSLYRQVWGRPYSPNDGVDDSLPWYWSNGNSATQFPAVTTLNSFVGSEWSYAPYPYGNAGATILSPNAISPLIINTIYNGHGVMAAGESRPGTSSYLPGYPGYNVNHWIVIRGYSNYGSTYYIVDPAKSSAVSWNGNISANYTITGNILAAYASYRGIIY